MSKTKAPKIRPHNKVAQVLLSGKVVSVDDIKASFAADTKMSALMYRLSTFIYDIRKFDNGVIKVIKDGRKVTAYQLVNFKEFDKNGCYTGKPAATATPVETKEVTEAV
jgi:asparagine N-glycosylation enzyme membrane subunit Stt3